MPVRTEIAIAAALVLAGSAFADEEKWDVVVKEPILVKTRAKPGTSIKEIWAEGELNAPLSDIQSVLGDPESFPKYMPYVKESRILGKPESDGSVFVYIKLDLPMITSRDYINHVTVDENPKSDGSGAYRQHWVTVPDKTPERSGVVRLKTNNGSWSISSKGPDKSFAVYKFDTDPGGWIPGWVADMGNKTGVTDTFKAIEKEAKRRAEEKRAATASKK